MLNKEVCKRCVRNHLGYWFKFDEERWNKENKVLCLGGAHNYRWMSTSGNPPEKCDFLMEQIVMCQAKVDESQKNAE